VDFRIAPRLQFSSARGGSVSGIVFENPKVVVNFGVMASSVVG